jgi:dihydroorotate dehydrogenase
MLGLDWYGLVRKVMFKMSGETSHELGLDMLGAAERLSLLSYIAPKIPDCPVESMGITFPNPVGLAAGLDKNGDYIDAFARLGFGFIEIGTITPRSVLLINRRSLIAWASTIKVLITSLSK